jgi:hypothetical protein
MENMAAPCGLYCGECKDLKVICEGCTYQKGKPYWTAKVNTVICPLYDCCINRKRLEHCGLCRELPCQLFNSFHDPALSSEEAGKAVLLRQNDLLHRKAVGTVKWLAEKAGVDKK